MPDKEPEEAVRRRTVDTSPEVFPFPQAYVPVPGEPPWRPCTPKGTGGPGPSRQRQRADWIRCTYQCGLYQVKQFIFGRKSEECEEKRNMDRAEQLARDFHHAKGERP